MSEEWDENGEQKEPWVYRRFWESPDGSAIRGYSETDMEHLCENWETLDRYTASPIEKALGNELFHQFTLLRQYWPFIIRPHENRYPKTGYSIKPQMPVGRYRADFGITLIEGESDTGSCGVYMSDELPHHYHAQLIVECDGHDFHEKTKEQAAHDKRRDRALLENGWAVVRFTGSEIHNDPTGCALQVCQILRAMVDAEAEATKDIRAQARKRRIERRQGQES